MPVRAPSISRRSQHAFSMMELVVVVGVLGVLSALAIPAFQGMFSDSKRIIATEVLETLNRGLKNHAQSNYEFVLAADNDSTDDEMAIVRSLQWRDPLDPATGAPYLRPNWNPSTSSSAEDFRLQWNGRTFTLIEPGTDGSGVKVNFEATDYGGNYNFPDDFVPVGG